MNKLTHWLAFGFAAILLTGCTQDAANLNRIEVKVDKISKQLEAFAPGASVGETGGALADSADPEFARKLAMANEKGQVDLIQQKLGAAKTHEALTIESLHIVTRDMMGLDTIIGYGATANPQLLADVEQEHQRLLMLMESGVPKLVKQIGENALAEQDYQNAQRIWNTGNAVLEYYPSSTEPIKEAAYQELATAHEQIGSRIELLQHQRYNQWATGQLREAKKQVDIAANDVERKQFVIDLLGPVDPSLLEPITLNLYSGFLETLQNEVSLDAYFTIAENLSVAERKSLFDL